MAGDVGGFSNAVYIFCVLIVGGYAHRMLFANVIQDIFKVRLSTNGAEIKELVKQKT